MLDSANYNSGTVTIGKSASILAVPGAVGSIVSLNGGPAISITADSLKVALRNVVIGPVAGATAGTSGVVMTGASSLAVENSLIANLPLRGVYVVGAGTLKVSDATLRNNGEYAIWLENGASAVISSTRMLDNGYGVLAYASAASTTTTATLSDCVISGGSSGVYALAFAAATARISVARSTIERTTSALFSQTAGVGTAEVNVGSSLIVNNTYAWNQDAIGSTVYSLGNNQMSGNATSFGTKTPLTGQ
jgi:hypothetical protein